MGKGMYIVQDVTRGFCRTVIAHSPKTAMQRFVATYRPDHGERFRVKARGGDEWVEYVVK